MSPRPRKVTDEEVFAAAYRAMSRLPPHEFTLAEIAAEAGVTASALVQRFGSKRALLLALSAGAAGSSADFIREQRATKGSPLAALRSYAQCLAQLASTPATLARNLAWLQIDLTDPEFRVHLLAQARTTRAALESLIADAVAEGEIVGGTDPRALARAVEAIIGGSMMQWAMYQKGTAARWIRADLETLLAPYTAARNANQGTAAGR
ncbi:MAG TPA: TetR family transcriptional regulator [Gemmatimonadaceae bacterium]|nr:TetR family transcriptional regulator [Gemmatimonadaceae bacterium]